MIVQKRRFMIRWVVVTEIEPHIEEQISRLEVDLHLRSREPIDEPVEGIVFSYTVVDEGGIFCRDLRRAERPTRPVILQHTDLGSTYPYPQIR